MIGSVAGADRDPWGSLAYSLTTAPRLSTLHKGFSLVSALTSMLNRCFMVYAVFFKLLFHSGCSVSILLYTLRGENGAIYKLKRSFGCRHRRNLRMTLFLFQVEPFWFEVEPFWVQSTLCENCSGQSGGQTDRQKKRQCGGKYIHLFRRERVCGRERCYTERKRWKERARPREMERERVRGQRGKSIQIPLK